MKIIVTEEQKEIIKKGKELRDAKILDINTISIDGDDKKSKKYRKKKVKKLRRAEKRRQSLTYLTNTTRRGVKQLLMHVYIENEDRSKSTISKRNKVEVALINQSLKYFKKEIATKVYQDQIYKRIENNKVRDRIILGQLCRDE